MDDFDDLLASLTQPAQQPFRTQSKPADSRGGGGGRSSKQDDDLLGDYFPSSGGFKTGTTSQPTTTFTRSKTSNVDDVLKIFDDDDEFGGGAKSKGKQAPLSAMSAKKPTGGGGGFFEEFDFDAKPSFGGTQPSSSIGFGDNMKDKRSALFGLPAKNSWESKQQQQQDTYSLSSSKDLFREKDDGLQFDDIPRSKQTGTTIGAPVTGFGGTTAMKSKSVLDDSGDDFFDNGQSRRGRGIQRKSSSQIGKDDNRSNSPLGASTKRSIFDENPAPKTTNNLFEEAEEFGGYNPTLSRIPSRARSNNNIKDNSLESQKPPRLMRMHDDSSNDTREPAAPTRGGFGGGQFGSNRDFGNGGDYDNPQQQPSNGIMLRTDKSSVLDSMDRPSEIMKRGQQQQQQQQGGLFSLKNDGGSKGDSSGLFSPAKSNNNNTNYYAPSQQQQAMSRGDLDMFSRNDIYNKETVNDFFKPNATTGGGAAFGANQTVDLTNMMKQQQQQRQQMEQEMAAQLASLKKNYESQIEMMRGNFDDQVKHERKMRESAVEDMQRSIKAEKDRMRVLHEAELKQKDDAFSYEKQQLKRAFESEAEMLKRQIDSQTQMVYLAEEFRVNSEKLASLQTRVEQAPVHSISDAELRAREERVTQRERRCQVDMEVIDQERIRNQKVKEDLQTRENTMRIEIDAEKSLLKREYARLVELQDTISAQEVEKKRQDALSKQEVELEKSQLEKERLALKEEYESRYGDFEMKVTMFAKQKAVEEAQLAKLESMHKQKIKEAEEMRSRNADIEAMLIQRAKATELKELELSRREMECKKIAGVSDFERAQFSEEQRKLHELHRQMQRDEESVLEFKRNFKDEKDKLNNLAADLVIRERKVQQEIRNVVTEKQDIVAMHRTLESLKTRAIRDLDPQRIALTHTRSISQSIAGGFNQNDDQTIASHKENNRAASNQLANGGGAAHHARSTSLHVQQHKQQMPLPKGGASRPLNSTSRDQFNLNNFMNEVKAIENHTNFNQAYLSKERENLFVRNQVAYGVVSAGESSQNQRSGSYTQSQFYDSSPYLQKPSRSSIDTNPQHY